LTPSRDQEVSLVTVGLNGAWDGERGQNITVNCSFFMAIVFWYWRPAVKNIIITVLDYPLDACMSMLDLIFRLLLVPVNTNQVPCLLAWTLQYRV